MKIKQGYVLRTVADMHVVVTVGEEVIKRNSMFSLNETGAFLWGLLEKDASEDNLIQQLLSEYDVTQDEAKENVAEFIQTLEQYEILDKEDY